MSLPVRYDPQTGGVQIVDLSTGDILPVRDASDRALAHAAERIAVADRELLELKRAVAAELRDRHGVGYCSAGGYEFKVTEAQTWPVGATKTALYDLMERGFISPGDVQRCMPNAPKPDGRQLKALAARLALKDADAHNTLLGALTTSPPAVRDVHATATDASTS